MAYASTFSATVEHIESSTTLGDVQSVQIRQGRSNLSDTYKSAVFTIEGREPDSLPNIAIGDFLLITVEAFEDGVPVVLDAYESEHLGRVADIQFDYGIVPAMDTWTITTEDAVAILGRSTVSLSVPAGTVSGDAAKLITDAVGVTMTIAGSSIPSPTTVKATVFENANALDAFQTYANTEMAFVVQQGDELLWVPRKGWTYTGSACVFTDDPTDVGEFDFKYQGLRVSGLADTVADEVVISIRDGNTVTTGTGNTYIQFQTFDSSDAQAEDLAEYIKALFTNAEPQPYVLDFILNGQNPETILEPVATELRQIDLRFRGSESKALVLGFSLVITPSEARGSLNLLSINQIPLFQLDIPSNGVLDTNVLGY
jgi:hypothetical protein